MKTPLIDGLQSISSETRTGLALIAGVS